MSTDKIQKFIESTKKHNDRTFELIESTEKKIKELCEIYDAEIKSLKDIIDAQKLFYNEHEQFNTESYISDRKKGTYSYHVRHPTKNVRLKINGHFVNDRKVIDSIVML